jgi:hypothetical protein
MRNDEVCSVKLTAMNIFKTLLGVLLVSAVGTCVVTFPFVLCMLFGGEPRSRHPRYASRQRPIRTRGRYSQKSADKYDEATLGEPSKSTHAFIEESTDHRRSGQRDHPGDHNTSGNAPTNR